MKLREREREVEALRGIQNVSLLLLPPPAPPPSSACCCWTPDGGADASRRAEAEAEKLRERLEEKVGGRWRDEGGM